MSETSTCPYCQAKVDGDGDVVTCPDCSARHHRECWKDNGGCAVVSCDGGTENSPGQETAVVCSTCGHREPAGSRFCGGCGRALSGADEDPTGPPKLPGIGAAAAGAGSHPPVAVGGGKMPWRTIGVLGGIALALGVLVMVLTAGPSQEDLAAEARANYDACENQLGDFLSAVREIDSRLDVSVSLSEYQDTVADANVAEGDVAVPALDATCHNEVFLPATDALNLYVEAEDEWSSCMDDFYCSDVSSDTEVQSKWSDASSYVSEAEEGLAAIGEPLPTESE